MLCGVLVHDHGLVQRGTALPYQASGDDLGDEDEDQQEELAMGRDKVTEEVRESGIGVGDASQRRGDDCDLIANDGRLVMTPDRTARRDTLRPCACGEDGTSSGVVPECHSRHHHEHACLDPCFEHLQSIGLHHRLRSRAWVGGALCPRKKQSGVDVVARSWGDGLYPHGAGHPGAVSLAGMESCGRVWKLNLILLRPDQRFCGCVSDQCGSEAKGAIEACCRELDLGRAVMEKRVIDHAEATLLGCCEPSHDASESESGDDLDHLLRSW